VPTAARQAAELGHALEQELRVLLIHGLLHLLGYDHERGPEAAAEMARREAELLAALDPEGNGAGLIARSGAVG
jgi:rRNA maturation RNase YbeY